MGPHPSLQGLSPNSLCFHQSPRIQLSLPAEAHLGYNHAPLSSGEPELCSPFWSALNLATLPPGVAGQGQLGPQALIDPHGPITTTFFSRAALDVPVKAPSTQSVTAHLLPCIPAMKRLQGQLVSPSRMCILVALDM